MRSVSIIGAGYTYMGDVQTTPEIKDYTERELFASACMEAMENGGIEAPNIDAFYLGCSGPNYNSKMKSATTHFSEWIGMRHKPAVFHDEGCATAAFGLEMAVNAVASGRYDCVISGAVNILSSAPLYARPPFLRKPLTGDDFWAAIHTGIDAAYEKPGTGGAGGPEAGLVLYCKKYGISFEELTDAMISYAIESRGQALLNPKATAVIETYEDEAKRHGFSDVKSYLLSDKYNPRMGAITRSKFVGKFVDGASAIIVCATEKAHLYTKKPIEVAGIATSVMPHKTAVEFPARPVVQVFNQAYAMAGIVDPFHEVEYFGCHDCPIGTIFEAGEAAGYFKPGTAWQYMRDGRLGINGDKPVTTSGGRTQMGHPTAPAFGIEIREAIDQMRGENGARQMPRPPKISAIYGAGSGWHCGAAVLKTL
ncbi:MAG: thiolase family protein [Oscillospiraceae bacterium]